MNFKITRLAAMLAGMALSTLLANTANAQSTGANGAFSPSTSVAVPLPANGILNYTTINIPAGVTVTFTPNATNTPVYMLATGAVNIAGTINISGANSPDTGAIGTGNLGTDGNPGAGGPGGYGGGRGGAPDPNNTAANQVSGAGLGPGGGPSQIANPFNGYPSNFGSFATGGVTNQGQYAVGFDYGSSTLQPLIGGSGGAGGFGGTNFSGSGGGGGGGAILISTPTTISLTGSILANGGSSGAVGGTGRGYWGGGGSGGAVRLVAQTISGTGSVSAAGGCANSLPIASGNCAQPVNGGGWVGGNGYIKFEAPTLTFSGASSPSYIAATTQAPLFISSAPSIVITSVNGTAVPAAPTGNADVTLPSETSTPIAIVFTTTNVPVGNTVQLSVVPAYGSAIIAQSGALTGTTAKATASVNVTLPAGPSTLIATTTYTIVVAEGDALSRYAENERVEKVQLIADLSGSESRAKLITVSGKEFVVPSSVLDFAEMGG